MQNLSKFVELNVLERTNWSNDDLIPHEKARWTTTKKYNPAMKFLPSKLLDAIKDKKLPQVLTQDIRYSRSSSDFMLFSWENWADFTREEIAAMKKRGDWSFMNKGLFKKVYEGDEPVLYEAKGNYYFVYKAVNAWGDSYRAREFYDIITSSKLENGTMKTIEVADEAIAPYFKEVGSVPDNPVYDVLGGEFKQKAKEQTQTPTNKIPYDSAPMTEEEVLAKAPPEVLEALRAAGLGIPEEIKGTPKQQKPKQPTQPQGGLTDEQIVNSKEYKDWLKEGGDNPFMSQEEILAYYKQCKL